MHSKLRRADPATLALMEAERLDAERKARFMPRADSTPPWAVEAQVEAFIDGLLVATMAHDALAYGHARRVGEWCARIAAHLPTIPSPAFMRRCGVLSSIEPRILRQRVETYEYADAVGAFQAARHTGVFEDVSDAVRVMIVADRFDALISCADADARLLPSAALRVMQTVEAPLQPVVAALTATFGRIPPDSRTSANRAA